MSILFFLSAVVHRLLARRLRPVPVPALVPRDSADLRVVTEGTARDLR